MLQLIQDLVLIFRTSCLEYVIAILYFMARCLRFLHRFRWMELLFILHNFCVDTLFFPLAFTIPPIRWIMTRNHLQWTVTNRARIEQDFQTQYDEVQRRLSAVISEAHVTYHNEDGESGIIHLFVFGSKLYMLMLSSIKLFIIGARYDSILKKESVLQNMVAIDNLFDAI